jgi:hypothetical protein
MANTANTPKGVCPRCSFTKVTKANNVRFVRLFVACRSYPPKTCREGHPPGDIVPEGTHLRAGGEATNYDRIGSGAAMIDIVLPHRSVAALRNFLTTVSGLLELP